MDRREIDPGFALAVLGAFDDLPVGVSILAFPPDGGEPRRLYVNRAFADLVGYTVDEVYQLPGRFPVADDEVPRVTEMLRAWSAGDSTGDVIETAITTKDGRRIPIEARIGYGALGDDRLVIAFVSNISRRVAALRDLRASEELFRHVAEAAPDAIVISVRGEVVYANAATARLLGHDPHQSLAGLPLAEILESDDVTPMFERMARLQRGEILEPREYRARRKDGSAVTVEISATATQFAGAPAILAVGRDVAERVRRQTELVRADRMAAVGALAAGVAHEVNNPLTYVILQLDRLRTRLDRLPLADGDRAPIDAMLADALDGSQRVAQIVRDLLWFAREDAGGRAPVNAAEPIDTAIKLATGAVRNRATVSRSLGDLPPVAGNAARLTQVFLNLIVNASQAFARADPEANRVEITARPDGDRVEIDVADNGAGIPEALRRRVFEPFFTTKNGGTGLGLAISRSIIEDAGGSIAVLARPGGGTIMRVTVQVWQGAAARPPVARPGPHAPRARVLVIDDEAALSHALAGALSDHHEVDVALTAAEALDRLETAEHAVVLCDLNLPGMSGLELARRVEAARPGHGVRFLFITGGAVPADVSAAIVALGGALLIKPFDMAAIDAAIADRLAASGAASATGP
jgi:PAS domain S-box-containing protein